MILGLNCARREGKKREGKEKEGKGRHGEGEEEEEEKKLVLVLICNFLILIRSSTYPEFIDHLVSVSVQCLLKVFCPTVKNF